MSTHRRRVTLKDVAARAGVSLMTASYAFTRPGRVADATRERVRRAAAELGYRPDAVGRALRSGRTRQLGMVFSEHLTYAFDDPQAARFLAGVAEVCVEEDHGLTFLPTRGDAADADRVLSAAVDAFVLWTTAEDDPVLAAVAEDPRPAVIQGGPARDGIACVTQDDYEAARAVAAHGLRDGRAPAVIAFPLDRGREPLVGTGADLPARVPFPVTEARLRGYRAAVEAAGLSWADVPVAVVARNSRHDGAAAARELAGRLSPRPLVIAMSDELALGARQALGETRPDAGYLGWDASPEGRLAGFTSVTNPLRDQGRRCARLALHPGTAGDRDIPWSITP
ncbi:LacI family DNA-binding transcriptional regulator [Actinomadura sp. ATCC 31491]|uniref:LacI family DNA-binding transcriptional regulator n=1 Tax=Actinomadura luzonensis TaxID=2805427 RepID=A0ABT0FUE5_9ACTN|nr:LacI family DNA-binding transcriptional regulator [Actinomadura luzonensis]MCK2215959.1 LacI family DNA-binding transcriptional regulator [Actinomadura luzonensis]